MNQFPTDATSDYSSYNTRTMADIKSDPVGIEHKANNSVPNKQESTPLAQSPVSVLRQHSFNFDSWEAAIENDSFPELNICPSATLKPVASTAEFKKTEEHSMSQSSSVASFDEQFMDCIFGSVGSILDEEKSFTDMLDDADGEFHDILHLTPEDEGKHSHTEILDDELPGKYNPICENHMPMVDYHYVMKRDQLKPIDAHHDVSNVNNNNSVNQDMSPQHPKMVTKEESEIHSKEITEPPQKNPELCSQQPSHQASRSPKQPENPKFVEETEKDILFGRGSKSNDHNWYFRHYVVAKHHHHYCLLCHRNERKKKLNIINELMDWVKTGDGRFLDFHKIHKRWFEQTDKDAIVRKLQKMIREYKFPGESQSKSKAAKKITLNEE